MFETWFNVLHLATEAQEVIGLRLFKLGTGGAAAQDEAYLMVSEKIDAAMVATVALMSGATADKIVAGYRREVQANARRLSGPR
ncbi:hypothetical protein [Enterovirga sp.]|uniref:hypothetical protein n=1 Tax=Enterovirga sp. TaxID=2026350 RepID=UPI002BF54048|nr:hypothetical protein [Enterovirga sp.]HMO28762.1 hypothetical protein [Enterovirga sp.]